MESRRTAGQDSAVYSFSHRLGQFLQRPAAERCLLHSEVKYHALSLCYHGRAASPSAHSEVLMSVNLGEMTAVAFAASKDLRKCA